MAVVVKNLVSDAAVAIGADGIEATDSYLVSGLTGSAESRVWVATQQSGIPQYGDPHPAIPGIFVDSVSARPEAEDPAAFRVVVVSRRPVVDESDQPSATEIDEQDFGVLEYFYLSREEQTQFDANGDQITVTHTYADDDPHQRGGLTVTQGGSVSVQTWQQGFRYTRRESRNPADLQVVYGSRLNRSRWNGYDERTVMCVGVDGRTDDGGATWTVTYSFLLDRVGQWRRSAIFADPEEGGAPPKGIELGSDAVKTLDVYPVVEFGGLRINLSRLRRSANSTPSSVQIGFSAFRR